VFPKWAWSGSREQFLHCGLRKFRHSKSAVYRWYTQLDRRRFVYDTCKTMKATRTRNGWVHMFITHQPTLTLQFHNFDLFRTCRTTSLCTVVWQLARFQLTRLIARSLGDSWASCAFLLLLLLLLYYMVCRRCHVRVEPSRSQIQTRIRSCLHSAQHQEAWWCDAVRREITKAACIPLTTCTWNTATEKGSVLFTVLCCKVFLLSCKFLFLFLF